MKKIISIITLAVFLSVLPLNVAKAEDIGKEHKKQFMEQIKQKNKL